MPKIKTELDINDQIFICQNEKNMTISEMAQKLQFPQYKIKEQLEILKANGIYNQFVNMTEEDIQKKNDITIPLHYNSMASKLLEKHNFQKSYVGFEFWKKLIALMMYKPEYLNKSLNSEIYPLIARKCNSTVANVESQLRFSLSAAMGKQKYTVVSFLSTMLNSNVDNKKEKDEKENNKLKEKIEEAEKEGNIMEKSTKDLTIIQNETLVSVPLKMINEYWYMKGFIDAIEGNNFKLTKAEEE